MKVLLTGGGSGGHFYPLIAVAEEINKIVKEEKLLSIELIYMSDSPHDPKMLAENNIRFIKISAGKARRYFSFLNFIDVFKTFFGVLSAIVKVYSVYPDVIFSKGAYASFPVLVAGRLLKIPVFIHESDSAPGRTNKWAGKFAKRIALSYPDAAKFFNDKKVAITGNPVRDSIKLLQPKDTCRQFYNFSENIPVVLVLGGSLGAQIINEQILNILPQLVENYYIIHQAGKNNIEEVKSTGDVILRDSAHKDRYMPFDYLDDLHMNMAAGASDIVVSRAGSTIFEIANWGVPSIIIPITNSNGDHQRQNAYYYAKFGGAQIIEEVNLTSNILLAEINRITSNQELIEKMKLGAKSFVKTDAARTIAKEILNIGLTHEK